MESKDFYGKILKIATIFGLLFVIVIGFDKMRTIFDTILTAFMPFIVGGTTLAVILLMTMGYANASRNVVLFVGTLFFQMVNMDIWVQVESGGQCLHIKTTSLLQ